MPLPPPVDLDDLLEPFSRRGVDLGLARLTAALAEGGDPQRRFPAVQVATVTVHKPAAPIPVPFDDVAVRVTRSR